VSALPQSKDANSLRDEIPLAVPDTGKTWLGDGTVELGLEVLRDSHLFICFTISTLDDKGFGVGVFTEAHD
jgi:hypothetical protein